MRGVINSLRSGDWLTRERMRLVAFAVLFASLVGLVAIVARSDGYLDARGHPIGTDFANAYAAGTYVLEGRPEAPFDPASQHARQQEIFGANTPFYGWHYPPIFLFIAAAALRARAGGVARDHLPALSHGDPRDPAPARNAIQRAGG
jgi:alpha-1,2-mannosyltransferase